MIGLMFLGLAVVFGAVVLAIGFYENYKAKGYNMPEESQTFTTSTSSSSSATIGFVTVHPKWYHLAITNKKGRKTLFVNGKKVSIKDDYTLEFWSQDTELAYLAEYDEPLMRRCKWTKNFTPPTEPYSK